MNDTISNAFESIPKTAATAPPRDTASKKAALHCPACSSTEIRASTSTRAIDAFFQVARMSAFRCRTCGKRFHARFRDDAPNSIRRPKKRASRHREPFWQQRSVRRRGAQITIAAAATVCFVLFLYLITRSGLVI